jgi:hypothetical protein
MMDRSTGKFVIADEAEISRHGMLKREERLVLAYQLAGLLHRLGIDTDVLDPSEIERLVERLERVKESPPAAVGRTWPHPS